jgi:hypothetical protein
MLRNPAVHCNEPRRLQSADSAEASQQSNERSRSPLRSCSDEPRAAVCYGWPSVCLSQEFTDVDMPKLLHHTDSSKEWGAANNP